VRGVRPIERSVVDQQYPVSEVVNGYCLAVRSALTDDGHLPLDAQGLLHSPKYSIRELRITSTGTGCCSQISSAATPCCNNISSPSIIIAS
jgi:hypothetical protein